MPTWSNGYDISLSRTGRTYGSSTVTSPFWRGEVISSLHLGEYHNEETRKMSSLTQNGYNPGSTPGVGVLPFCHILGMYNKDTGCF